MSKNTGGPYEQLTKHIFEQLVNQDEVKTIKLQHNVTLQGKDIRHQIDVYWKFERGGIKYFTIVQAKDWNQAVEQGQLLQFKAVLDDMPFQATGIFVTRTGYQKGARDLAKANGILLYELREPNEADWKGKLKTIVIKLNSFHLESSDIDLEPDNEWIVEERRKRDIPEHESLEIDIQEFTNKVIIYDENDEKTMTVKNIIDSFSSHEEIPPTKKQYTFDKPAFIHTGVERFPKLKIKALEATISVSKEVREIRIDGEDIVGFVLNNVLEKCQHTFDKDMKLR